MSTASDTPKRAKDVTALGTLATATTSDNKLGGEGSLARSWKPAIEKDYVAGGTPYGKQGVVDILNEYPWTLTNVKGRTDIPYIELREYKIEEGILYQQMNFFKNENIDKMTRAELRETLGIYEEIWPKNTTTKSPWNYIIPYFNDISFSLSTPAWQRLDDIGPKIGEVASGASSAIEKILGKDNAISSGIDWGKGAADLASKITDVSLAWKYPSVGAADRPKIFASHAERTIKIEFPLYNTINKDDWKKNRDFLYLFMSQNLYNKRDHATGVPPVWYELEVPGNYFCVAACVTDFTVTNLGNIRSIEKRNIPDAYQISITLQEMTMPSKNQFEYIMYS